MRVGIIGAGLAGLACGAALTAAGHAVTLLDKGRGPGGRMSSRRIATPAGEAQFDHGAQYFTVRDPRFAAAVQAWHAAGLVAPWPAAGDGCWVGTPAMNAPLRDLASRADVQWGVQVTAVQHGAAGWTLGPSFGPVDALVLAVPAENAAPLLASAAPELAALARATPAQPCWTVMAAFAAPVPAPDILREDGPIGWAARNSAKPGRTGPEAWVIQAGPDWSRQHLEDPAGTVMEALLSALSARIGARLPPVLAVAAHRWRYSRSGHAGRPAAWDAQRRLAVCGDWLLGPRVECGWLSGAAAASLIGS